MSASKDQIIEYLHKLELPEVIEIFYQFFDEVSDEQEINHPGTTDLPGSKVVYRYFIKHVIESIEDDAAWGDDFRNLIGSEDDDLEVETRSEYIIACKDPDEYGNRKFASDICQCGHCPQCDIHLISYAKKAICPVCGAKCYLT